MARTTQLEVQNVLTDNYVTGDDLCWAIDIATLLVTRVGTCASNRNKSLTTGELTRLEALLAAYFYSKSKGVYKEKETGDARAVWFGKDGMGLEGNPYGEMALAFDYSGCLSAISKNNRVRIEWLGKPRSEQTDYSLRD